MRSLLSSTILLLLLCYPAILTAQEEEPPDAPPTITQERERLGMLKTAEFEKHKAVVFGDSSYEEKLSSLKMIAGLGTVQAAELLDTLYDNPIGESEESKAKERVLIVGLLEEIGSPACASTVLKAARHPGKNSEIREAAAKALWKTMEKQALPHLKKLAEDPEETVRNAAWLELLKVRDMGAMRHIFKKLEGEKKLAALQMIKEAHFTEAAEDAAKLAKETDFAKGPNEKILKLKALETALDLGHKGSSAIALKLLGSISEEQAQVLEVEMSENLVRKYVWPLTIMTDANESWEEWVKKHCQDTPLFSRYLNATDLQDIATAAMEYLRSKKSGPVVKGEIIYLKKLPFAQAAAAIDEKVRVYTQSELSLLGVHYFAENKIVSNGTHAVVDIHHYGEVHTLHMLELTKKDKTWHIGITGTLK